MLFIDSHINRKVTYNRDLWIFYGFHFRFSFPCHIDCYQIKIVPEILPQFLAKNVLDYRNDIVFVMNRYCTSIAVLYRCMYWTKNYLNFNFFFLNNRFVLIRMLILDNSNAWNITIKHFKVHNMNGKHI